MPYLSSRILQALFMFEDTSYIITSLDSITSKEKVTLACSRCGSHVLEAMANSTTVQPKAKMNFISSLKVGVAVSLHGCYFFYSLHQKFYRFRGNTCF